MKVYVLTDDDYEKSVYGVFDSIAKAEEMAFKKREVWNKWKWKIWETEINQEHEIGFF